MIEIARLKELQAFMRSHRHSTPELIATAYQINRKQSRNTLEDYKERALMAAILPVNAGIKNTGG
jgi:hypothetical protein